MFKVIVFATILAVAAAKPGLIAENIITPSLGLENTAYLGYAGLPLPLTSRYYQQQYLQPGYLPSTSYSSSYNYNSGLKYLGYSGLGLQYQHQYNKSPYYNYYY